MVAKKVWECVVNLMEMTHCACHHLPEIASSPSHPGPGSEGASGSLKLRGVKDGCAKKRQSHGLSMKIVSPVGMTRDEEAFLCRHSPHLQYVMVDEASRLWAKAAMTYFLRKTSLVPLLQRKSRF